MANCERDKRTNEPTKSLHMLDSHPKLDSNFYWLCFYDLLLHAHQYPRHPAEMSGRSIQGRGAPVKKLLAVCCERLCPARPACLKLARNLSTDLVCGVKDIT
eukprot:1158412-Pelagomonas_calceolata.AAC.1